jgi:hypothetical protein
LFIIPTDFDLCFLGFNNFVSLSKHWCSKKLKFISPKLINLLSILFKSELSSSLALLWDSSEVLQDDKFELWEEESAEIELGKFTSSVSRNGLIIIVLVWSCSSSSQFKSNSDEKYSIFVPFSTVSKLFTFKISNWLFGLGIFLVSSSVISEFNFLLKLEFNS